MNKDARFRWASAYLHDRVRTAAEDEGRSLSNMINRLLSEALDTRQLRDLKKQEKQKIKHEGTVT